MVILTVFNIIIRFLGFAFKIFLSRTLTTAMLGLYTITISILMVFLTIISSGVPFSISKEVSQNKNLEKNKSNKIVSAGLVITISISIFIIALVFIFKNFFYSILSNNECYKLLLYMLPVVFATAIYCPIKGYFWGKENYIKVSLVELIEQVIRVMSYVLLVIIIADNTSLLPVGVSLSIAAIISTIMGVIYFLKDKNKFKLDRKYFKPILKSSAPLIAIRVIGSIVQPLISIILPFMLILSGYSNEQALSEIGIIMGMSLPILTIPSTIIGSLCMALVPKLSNLFAQKRYSQFVKQLKSALLLAMGIVFLFVPVFLSIGKPIAILFFNNQMAGTYIVYGTLAMIPMSLSFLTTNIINAMGFEKQSFYYFILSGIIILLCVVLLPYFIGINSLIYALGLSSLLLCYLNIRKVEKCIQIKLHLNKDSIKIIISSIPPALLTYFTFSLFNSFLNLFFSICLACGICIFSYVLFLFIFNIINIESIKNSIKNRKKIKAYKTKYIKM